MRLGLQTNQLRDNFIHHKQHNSKSILQVAGSYLPQSFSIHHLALIALAKRQFTIDTGKEQIPVEGQVHRNVAVKYLMKRRRSLLMTKNPEKVEKLWSDLPKKIKIIGKQLTREYKINWERLGTEEYEGSRFVFTLDDLGEKTTKN